MAATGEIRQVQSSDVFSTTAWAIASSKVADSAGAAEYVSWLCGETRLFVPRHFGELKLASIPSVDDPYLADVVFLVRGESVLLLSPLRSGYPAGGLDTAAWNQHIMQRGGWDIDTHARARALACALHRIQQLAFVNPECGPSEIEELILKDDVWTARFRTAAPGNPASLRFTRDGMIY
jgi:hypothetical protein